MELYKNTELFKEIINRCEQKYGINQAIIEKDYFVSYLLNLLNHSINGLLFKGGTSLSKCFGIINRFSEDIDLTLDLKHFSQSNKRKANKLIIDICDQIGFKIINRSEVIKHSHGNFNRYIVEYPRIFNSDFINSNLIIELTFLTKSFPYEVKGVSSIVYEYLYKNNYNEIIDEYNLNPFSIEVQTIERTLIDKVFALCDYYLNNEIENHSRHLYDIYKILGVKNLKISKALVDEVRLERSKHDICISAKDNAHIPNILKDIIEKNIYKNDYKKITSLLLNENITYDTVISSLITIINLNVF